MMRKYFDRRGDEKKAALERIKVLFALARQEFPKYPDRANRYAEMINNIVKKVRVRPSGDVRHFICKECNHFLMPGKNLRVESVDGFMVYTCLDCGSVKKYGYIREKRGNE
ncbi:MAG TPA: ribonuclease P protein component 4 [Candidatus Nanoarchaeia archaeon]|nr:ribonuclease P protein component 4 [Candidatus Nanoarchaeia archaeon]